MAAAAAARPRARRRSAQTGGGGGGGGGGFGGGLFSGSVGSVTPSPDAVTMREHASFVRAAGHTTFQPRIDDPRAGYGGATFVDYSQPIGEPIQFRYIRRHRLQKKDPSAAISEPVKPIQYWVDSGAPEDVKKALLEGAMWWNQAFEAAGFRNAFKVDVLPADADPMDIRYNMINWVHRSTRGWSSGGSVSDPRTGEIIKATVTLGSLRDRQDYMIFEGLLSPYAQRRRAAGGPLRDRARAHPPAVGARSRPHARPRPQLLRQQQGLDLGDGLPASARELQRRRHASICRRPTTQNIGDWDKVAINYGYREFPKGANEQAALTKILDDAWDEDLRYFTNQDTDIHPKRRAVVERRQPGRRADAADEGAPRRARIASA